MAGSHSRWCYRLGSSLYVHLTSECNAVSLVASRGPGFRTPWLPAAGADPSPEELLTEIQSELLREPAEAVVFAGHGEPLMALGSLLTTCRGLQPAAMPLRLNTNGLGNLLHKRDVLPELAAAGVCSLSVALNAASAASYRLHVRPKVDGATAEEAFKGVCSFVSAGVQLLGPDQVEVTCVEAPGVNVAAVQALSQSLGASKFRARSYHYIEPAEAFATHRAAYAGDMAALADQVDVDAKDDRGNTPLVWAAEAGRADVVRALVQEHGSAVDVPGMSGNTALHRSANRGHLAVLETLLHLRANPDIYNDRQQTPLHHAAFYQHPDCVRALLQAGADATRVDAKGRQPAEDTASEEVRSVFSDWPGTPEGKL